jgi:hypothetical protein
MKTLLLFLICFLAVLPPVYTQQTTTSDNDAGRLLFAPLMVSHLEPRVGLSRLVEEERLRLDIGNSVDLLHWTDVFGGADVAVGADFFTWTSLRQEADFHFPVDAVDYLFGINASYRRELENGVLLSARFRISHISAHLVDGSYVKAEERWRDDQLPRVYSREFFDLIVAADLAQWLRVYAGGKYIYHIDPADLGKWSPQAGFETVWLNAGIGKLYPYAAVDVRMLDVRGWSTAFGVQIGVKAGEWRGTALDIFLAYYDGPSQHGEYFDRTWSYWGPGFNIAF